ncbi:hypothetical protein IJ531_01460 [bacterium]|nr:hypothetical protein [bacterium]
MNKAEELKEEKNKYGKFDEWVIRDAVDCLVRAEEIKKDKEKMKYVLPMLDKQAKSILEAKSAAEILYGEDNKDDEE